MLHKQKVDLTSYGKQTDAQGKNSVFKLTMNNERPLNVTKMLIMVFHSTSTRYKLKTCTRKVSTSVLWTNPEKDAVSLE